MYNMNIYSGAGSITGVEHIVRCSDIITTSVCNHILGDIIAVQIPGWARGVFALQPSEEAQGVMYASSGLQARVVQRDPRLLMILTWQMLDVHRGAPPCNLLDFSLCGLNSPCPLYIWERIPRTLYRDWIICIATWPESPSGCAYISSMTRFNQWDYEA